MIAIPVLCAAVQLPPAPSKDPIYKTTVTTTTDETTSTWTAVDIGVPHPQRLVILCVYHGVAAAATATVNGISHCHRTQNTAHEFSMFAVPVPDGTDATITVSATGSTRKAVSVYVAYPNILLPLDSGTATANTTSNAVVSDQKVQRNGFFLYNGGQHATLGAFSITWNAGDPGGESVDAQLESVASYTAGYGNIATSSNTGDVTLSETVSGTKRLVVTSWGPPRDYAGLSI